MKHLLPIAIAAALLSGCAGTAFDKRVSAAEGTDEFGSFCQDRKALIQRFGVGNQITEDVVDTFVPNAVVGMANGDADANTAAEAINERCATSYGWGSGWRDDWGYDSDPEEIPIQSWW